MQAPPPSQVVAMALRSATAVIAVVVTRNLELEYLEAVTKGKSKILVLGVDYLEELEELLPRLDDMP